MEGLNQFLLDASSEVNTLFSINCEQHRLSSITWLPSSYSQGPSQFQTLLSFNRLDVFWGSVSPYSRALRQLVTVFRLLLLPKALSGGNVADARYASTVSQGALSLWVCLFLNCLMSACNVASSWLQQHGNNRKCLS